MLDTLAQLSYRAADETAQLKADPAANSDNRNEKHFLIWVYDELYAFQAPLSLGHAWH